jgi:tRNA-specific 2-thiouridylase
LKEYIDFVDLPKKSRIVVAMSGGVDSSVTAGLMVEAGYEVIGLTMQLYDNGEAMGRKGSCCAGQDIYDARQASSKLGIAHYVLNYESLFRQSVMDDFADTYIRGETPIPCVRCNQSVKFKELLSSAKDLGAEALITGHYVRRRAGQSGPELHRAIDHDRDQSYFLFATTAEQLNFLRFPLGEIRKSETRKLARKFGLSVADKPDSQDICFVPNGNYARIVEKLRPGALDEGDILHINGEKLGRHKGIINYTIGQRKGLGIGQGGPFYVIKINPKSRCVYVGPKEALACQLIDIKEVNWLSAHKPMSPHPVTVKIRSTQNVLPAKAYFINDTHMRVILNEPEYGVSPGQACVLYQDERVLGGGWIHNGLCNL